MREVCLLNHTKHYHIPEKVVVLSSEDAIGEQVNNKIAFWLIDAGTDAGVALKVLQVIRNHSMPAIYLRPIIGITNENNKVLPAADALLSVNELNEENLNDLIDRFEPVNQWIDHVTTHSNNHDSGYVFRILRLIVSRNSEFVPQTSPRKLLGYSYPLLDALSGQDENSLFHALDLLESQKLIAGRFVTKAHFCCHCDCAFLNFKEVCPQCRSDNLSSHELIHHFKCSYVGESPEYVHGDELVCPKCDRKLKHIGVDFDKPSVVHRCNQCNNRFQEPLIVTQCFNCGRTTEPENQMMRSIKAYQSTAIGNNAAVFGMDSLFTKILEPKFNLFSAKEFRNFLLIEIERIKRYKLSTSSMLLIQFDIEHVYVTLGSKAQDLFAELSEVFKSILRSSDVISSQNESLFALLLVETSVENAQVALSRFEAGVNELVTHNLGYKLEFSSYIEEVGKDTELDKSVEKFLKT